MVISKKFEEFKTYMISELTESVKPFLQTEIHGILKGYKDQLENVTSIVEMLQEHVPNLKCKNVASASTWQQRIIVWKKSIQMDRVS